MRKIPLLRGGLFIIECARFSFLTGFLAILRHNAGIVFPWQVYAVPNALFVLMALFLMLNASQYAGYSLLYIAGKILCLFSEAMSSIALLKNISAINLLKTGSGASGIILPIVFVVDLITLIVILISTIKIKKSKPVLLASGTDAHNGDTGGQGGI
jgi:hypothetical protein